MLRCDEAQRWFGPYLDGALAADLLVRLEDHSLGCPICAHDLWSLQVVMARLRSCDTSSDPSDSFRSRVLRSLQADNPHCSAPQPAEPRFEYQLPFLLED